MLPLASIPSQGHMTHGTNLSTDAHTSTPGQSVTKLPLPESSPQLPMREVDPISQWPRWLPDINAIRRDKSGEVAWYFTYSQFSMIMHLIIGLIQCGPMLHHWLADTNPATLWYPTRMFLTSSIIDTTVFIHWRISTAIVLLLYLIAPFIYHALVGWLLHTGRAEDLHDGQYNNFAANCIDVIDNGTEAGDHNNGRVPTARQQNAGRRISAILFTVLVLINIGVNCAVFQSQEWLNDTRTTLVLSLLLELFKFLWFTICLRTTQLEHHHFSTSRNESLFIKVFVFNVVTSVFLLWFKQLFRQFFHSGNNYGVESTHTGDVGSNTSGTTNSTLGRNDTTSLLCPMDSIEYDFLILFATQFVGGVIFGWIGPRLQAPFFTWLRVHTQWMDEKDETAYFTANQEYAKLLFRHYLIIGATVAGMPIGMLGFATGCIDHVLNYIKLRYHVQAVGERLQNSYTTRLWQACTFLWVVAVFLPPSGAFFLWSGRVSNDACVIWQHNARPQTL